MRTNIVIDDKLMEEAMKLSNVKTKKDIIQLALEEYVMNKKKMNLGELKGMIMFEDGYDYKAMREGK